MTTFRTAIDVPVSSQKIDHKSSVLTIGSCFADAIGQRLATYKFPCQINPFGVLYNPLSIHKALSYMATGGAPAPDTYLQNGEFWLNYDFHSQWSALSREALEARLGQHIAENAGFLKTTSHLLITYGTAWVYVRNNNGALVANCHKMPAASFSKRLLTADEIISSFEGIFSALKRISGEINIILTLSPVRHLKDTLPLNSVSKSVLRVACHEIATRFPGVDYFPAFEMMVDDLRDYRFYGRDMIHPSDEAEDYIWERFTAMYFGTEEKKFVREWSEILAALNHRPFQPQSVAHQRFLKKVLERLEHISPQVDVSAERAKVREDLKDA